MCPQLGQNGGRRSLILLSIRVAVAFVAAPRLELKPPSARRRRGTRPPGRGLIRGLAGAEGQLCEPKALQLRVPPPPPGLKDVFLLTLILLQAQGPGSGLRGALRHRGGQLTQSRYCDAHPHRERCLELLPRGVGRCSRMLRPGPRPRRGRGPCRSLEPLLHPAGGAPSRAPPFREPPEGWGRFSPVSLAGGVLPSPPRHRGLLPEAPNQA